MTEIQTPGQAWLYVQSSLACIWLDPTVVHAYWYESGTFWSIVVALLALGTLAVSLVGFFVPPLTPRWKLLYGMSTPTPLLAVPAGMREDIEVFHRGGHALTDPHIVEVYLASRSRSDILKDNFNGPLILDLGRPIISLDSKAQEVLAGSAISVGPRLIRRHEVLTFTALIDGPAASLTYRNPPGNVSFRNPRSRISRWLEGLTAGSQASALIFAASIVAGVISIVAGLTVRYTGSILATVLLLLGAAVIGGAVLASLVRVLVGVRRIPITVLSSAALLFVVGVVAGVISYGIHRANTIEIVSPRDGGRVGYLQAIRLQALDAGPGQSVWVLVSPIGSQSTYPQGPCDAQQSTDEYLCPRTEFGAPGTNGKEYKFYLQAILVGPATYNELQRHVRTGLETTPQVAAASPIITVHR